ncbi:MAG: penicillin-binding protein 2 [Armatimonadetes bacterium]|nr:penicillin-binding protein 2 [Armatimonadota bacterium]
MEQKAFELRILLLRLAIIAAFVVIAGRLFFLQIVNGAQFRLRAEENRIREIPIPAPRGDIYDRKGRVLVRNTPSFEVTLIPEELKRPGEVLPLVGALLSLSPDVIRKKIEAHTNPAAPLKLRENLDFPTLARLCERLADLPGVHLDVRPIRKYPYGRMACHALGYVGEISEEQLKKLRSRGYKMGDLMGKEGVEKEYDELLRGKEGGLRLEVNAQGRVVKVLGERNPIAGRALYLTLDNEVQRAAETALESTLQELAKNNGSKTPGAVVALDPRTGEVLAMVSRPGYFPSLFAGGISVRDYRSLMTHPFYPLYNRAITGAYPCGSTFKLVTGTAALQSKIVSGNSSLYCSGVFMGVGVPFHCFVTSGHGTIGFVEAVGQSCDVFFYTCGYRLGIKRLYYYASQYGLGQPTGIDMPGESGGLLPGEAWKKEVLHDQWYEGETVNLSIGQGYLQVTPLQLGVVGSVVATSGSFYRPHLFKKAISPEGKVVRAYSPVFVRKVPISARNFAFMRQGMRAAVTHGTSTAANIPQVEVAGKTGTAENMPSAENPAGRNHAWFVCMAPYKKPEIVVAVCLEQSGGFGGQWAAPIARKVLEAYFQLGKKEEKKDGARVKVKTGD